MVSMATPTTMMTDVPPMDSELILNTLPVMIGSSETTFYVAAVYFSAAGVKRSRWAIPAALCADLVCFLSSAWICRLLWG